MMCAYPTCDNVCDKFKDGTYKLHCSRSCCSKHNAQKSIEKKKLTCIEKYGTPYPIQSAEVRDKIQTTLQSKYGVKNVSQIVEVKEKKKETLMINYGVDHPLKSKLIRDKVKLTLNNRYNVSHVSYIGKPADTINLLNDVSRIVELNKEFCLYSIARQHGLSDRTLREILENNGIEPIRHSGSSFEKEILLFIGTIYTGNIVVGSKVLDGKEIDIFLPELNLGFECNGAYWHSEVAGKRDKTYHLDKLTTSIEKKIKLIQIWDYDWYSKNYIIKSMIRHALGCSNKIHARKCDIRQLTQTEESKFFNENHIQGYIYSSIAYGLILNNEVVAGMSFVKSRYDKTVDIELLRFANKADNTVVGGASKLLNCFVKDNLSKSIISYSHRHISDGNLYRNLGFEYLRTTGPSCYYTNDYKIFKSRITYQKHKLEKLLPIFNKDNTEWDNMKNNGYDRIWDCGNDVWIFKGKV